MCSATHFGLMTANYNILVVLLIAPIVVGMALSYLARERAHGTFLASHFTWQIRTIGWAVIWIFGLWPLVKLFTLVVLAASLIFPPLAYVGIVTPWAVLIGKYVIAIWCFYRIGRGWFELLRHNSMSVKKPTTAINGEIATDKS